MSANTRRFRWEQLTAEHKGRIDVKTAQRLPSDHYSAFEKNVRANKRTLCGNIDFSPRGQNNWQPPFGAASAVQANANYAPMAEKLSLAASMGSPAASTLKHRNI